MTQEHFGWSQSISDMATAAHELGHAFAAREAGLYPGQLKINKWLGGGRCWVEDNPGLDDQTSLWATIVCYAAGQVGETIWRQRNELAAPWCYGSGADHDAIRQWLPLLDTPRTLGDAEAEAGTYLDLCWDELEPLIEVLAKRGSLPEIPTA